MNIDGNELTERAAWVCRRTGALGGAVDQLRLLGPAAGAGQLAGLRDEVGELVDTTRHLAEDQRLPARLRRRYHRLAGWLNGVYAQLGEVRESLC
jgi:hypothetical protein